MKRDWFVGNIIFLVHLTSDGPTQIVEFLRFPVAEQIQDFRMEHPFCQVWNFFKTQDQLIVWTNLRYLRGIMSRVGP